MEKTLEISMKMITELSTSLCELMSTGLDHVRIDY